jgi:hypothetical protein
MMSSGQELNSLSRFRKQSGRLVLEEHSHCEVPAGCGGVVLRWRNPLAAVPLTLHLYTPVPAACFLDGAPVGTARVDPAPGRHALALALENAPLSAGLILFAAVPPRNETQGGADVVQAPLQVLTADDGTWRATLKPPPGDDWKLPAFDDGEWTVLKAAPAPQLQRGDPGAYRCGECIRLGAICLGLPANVRGGMPASLWQRLFGPPGSPAVTGNVWIRKVFDIPLPRLREP